MARTCSISTSSFFNHHHGISGPGMQLKLAAKFQSVAALLALLGPGCIGK